MVSVNDCSGRTLAFLGDAVWSAVVRYALIERGEGRGSRLQKLSVQYVSAKAQASFYTYLHAQKFFTEAEEAVFRRGRNGNTGTVPHHTEPQTYRISTGFEAIIGALYMKNDQRRIEEILMKVESMEEK